MEKSLSDLEQKRTDKPPQKSLHLLARRRVASIALSQLTWKPHCGWNRYHTFSEAIVTLPLWPTCTTNSSSYIPFLPVWVTFQELPKRSWIRSGALWSTKRRRYRGKCVNIFSCTHSNDSLAEAERTPAAVLSLVLRFVVAQGVVFQHDPAVLPSMDVICPLEMSKGGEVSDVTVITFIW